MADPVVSPILIGLAMSAATAALSYLLTPPPADQEGPRRSDLAGTTSAYGKFRPINYGKTSTPGNVIDASDYYPQSNQEEVVGKGGKSSTLTTYTYSIDFALGLGEGPGEGATKELVSIEANGQMLYDVNGLVIKPDWLEFVFYEGTEDQLPDPTLQAIHGVDNTPAYRGESFIVFTKFQTADFSNRIPSLMRVVTVSNGTYESNEFEIVANPGFDTTADALLTQAKMNPGNGYMVHGWNWGALGTGRENPIGTVVDPQSGVVIYSLNKPDTIPVLGEVYPVFGSLTDVFNGVQVNGYYENIALMGSELGGSNYHLLVWNSDTNALQVSAVLLGSNSLPTIGSVLADGMIIYGFYYTDPVTSYFRYWNVNSSGDSDPIDDTYLDMSAIGLPGWRVDNIRLAFNGFGDILIHGEDSNNSFNSVIVKYTHLEGLKWWIPVISEFDPSETGYQAVSNSVYDADTDTWWTHNSSGTIWGINNLDGSTVGIFDISADPEFVPMSSLPSYSSDTRLFYWIANNDPTVAGSWNTVDRITVNSYPGNAITPHLNDYANCDYHAATRSLFFSTQNVARTKPSRKFRLQNLVDGQMSIGYIFGDICKRCGVPESNYDTTDVDDLFVGEGFTLTKLATGRANAAPLQHVALVDVVDSGGIIKFVQKGKLPVAALAMDDLGASVNLNDSPPAVTTTRIMESTLPATADIVYINPNTNYEPGAQHAERGASSNTNVLKLDLPVVLQDTPAKRLIDVILHLTHIERETYKLYLMPEWQWLDAGDVIEVQTDTKLLTMQLTRTSFVDNVLEVESVRNVRSVFTSYREGDSAPPRDNLVTVPGVMVFALLDMPLLRDIDDNAGFYSIATSYTEGWAGGIIFKSPDGSSWNVGSTFTQASVYGTTDSALPDPVSPWEWDNLNKIRVQVVSGELHSVTKEQALQGFNSFVYGQEGRWEIGNFVNAVEIIEGVYELDTLLRGRLGTDHNVNNHNASDIFIPLNTSNLEYIGNQLSDLNVLRSYRGVSIGVNLYASANVTKIFQNTGVSITPLSPQHIVGERDASLDMTITWMPRSRYPASNFWSAVPSEPDDLYDIEIYLGNSLTPVRSVVDNPGKSYHWSRAQQITDIGSDLPTVVDIRVWHKSSRVGRGYEGFGRSVVGDTPDKSFGDAVALVGPMMHFEFEEGYSPITDGSVAIDSMGNVLTATYNVVLGLLYAATTTPSNLDYDSNDKSLYQTWNIEAERLDIPWSELVTGGNTFSISFTCKFDTNKVNNAIVYFQNYCQVKLDVDSGEYVLHFTVYGPGGATSTIVKSTSITAGEDLDLRNNGDMFVVVTAFANDLSIFINGVRDTELVQDGNLSSHNTPEASFNYVTPQKVAIDNFAFYDKVLSDIEISYLYSNTGL